MNDFLINLKNTQNDINQIKQKIIDLNNNFFYEDDQQIYVKINDIISDQMMSNLIKNLTFLNNLIAKKKDQCCIKHEWIKDLIDLNPDSSQTIIYCSLCGISQKN